MLLMARSEPHVSEASKSDPTPRRMSVGFICILAIDYLYFFYSMNLVKQKAFKLRSDFKPAGDQPQAIEKLVGGLNKKQRYQTLLGVTGSGKTFTVANVIGRFKKPTLVIAHNKTLAAQLASEYREFFPDNEAHYFVSYYDYYQPEAYMPVTDTYIEKEAQINQEIERLRHASTQALLTRRDVIIVASVSCIYGLGSPAEYEKVNLKLALNMAISRQDLIRMCVGIHFKRTNSDLSPGTFRMVGNAMEIMPVNERLIYRIELSPGGITSIKSIDPITRSYKSERNSLYIFPAKHFIADSDQQKKALQSIKLELDNRLKELVSQGKALEAERLKRRTNYDLALIKEVGYCNGIENYSRHFSGKSPGEPPDTLLSYFPKDLQGKPDFLTIIDESHVTIPQLRGMRTGDKSRKETLIEHGFRLPSAGDNRPLSFDEFIERTGQTIFTSATPSKYETEKSSQIVKQIIRPTGLVDPRLEIIPITGTKSYPGQVVDFVEQAKISIKNGGRVIATTLTKKMAEDLSIYLKEKNVLAEYLHSDVKTIDRIEILSNFRKGKFDCIVGVNLLREGLDLPEVEFIGILDADKEGFLRSETSLIQIIGRAARNTAGRVRIYADKATKSIMNAVEETNHRRGIQMKFNKDNKITPRTVVKKIRDITEHLKTEHHKALEILLSIDKGRFLSNPRPIIAEKVKQMNEAVKILDFESAALLRDEIKALEALIPRNKKGNKNI